MAAAEPLRQTVLKTDDLSDERQPYWPQRSRIVEDFVVNRKALTA